MHAFDKFSIVPTLEETVKNISSSPDQIHLNPVDVLAMIGSTYRAVQSFVSSTPDFQILTTDEQRSLFDRNLNGVSSFGTNLFFRDSNLFDNAQFCTSLITLNGREAVHEIQHCIDHLDTDSTLLKLILLVIIFSSNSFIVHVDQNMHKDSLLYGTFRLLGSQNVYVEVLWKYMIYRYGYYETVMRFSRIIKCIVEKIRHFANNYQTNDLFHNYIDAINEKAKETLIMNQNQPIILWGKTGTFT